MLQLFQFCLNIASVLSLFPVQGRVRIFKDKMASGRNETTVYNEAQIMPLSNFTFDKSTAI